MNHVSTSVLGHLYLGEIRTFLIWPNTFLDCNEFEKFLYETILSRDSI